MPGQKEQTLFIVGDPGCQR